MRPSMQIDDPSFGSIAEGMPDPINMTQSIASSIKELDSSMLKQSIAGS
jgi:hypothetical protein